MFVQCENGKYYDTGATWDIGTVRVTLIDNGLLETVWRNKKKLSAVNMVKRAKVIMEILGFKVKHIVSTAEPRVLNGAVVKDAVGSIFEIRGPIPPPLSGRGIDIPTGVVLGFETIVTEHLLSRMIGTDFIDQMTGGKPDKLIKKVKKLGIVTIKWPKH